MRTALLISLCCIVAAKHHRHRVPIINLRGADQLVANIREDENVLNTVPDLAIVAETALQDLCVNTSFPPWKVLFHLKHRLLIGILVLQLLESRFAKEITYFLHEVAIILWTLGKVDHQIAVLKASDSDCGSPYGEICEYEITNGLKDFPFAISKQGILRNTQPLNYTQTKSYILTVVAIDCGMRRSKSALVTVNVEETCVQGISHTNDRHVLIYLLMFLYSNCGLSPATVSLLPSTSSSSSDESDDASSLSEVHFDGATNSVVVSTNTVKGLIPDKLALSFSMKHPKGTKEEQNNKQNILCESDDFNMNRHHFSVYVRHCKLEVVLRREAGSQAEFRAAEWRWAMPQVCDNEWHSYSLLFNGVDDVHLVVDGVSFKADERNPEILDDWPLHKTKQEKTKLVIGACWHGRQQTMAQFFRGSLSSVHLLLGSTETPAAIECAHRCPEQLQYTGIDEIIEGQSVTFSSDQSIVTLKASNTKEISKMLQRVAYTNIQEKPIPGHRSWNMATSVECKGGKKMELPSVKGYIFVEKESDPVLSLSGSVVLSADQHAVKTGTPMIPDIQITVSQTSSEGEVKDVTSSYPLDYCKVHLKPSRDMDLEYFSSPASLIASLQIDFEHDKEGILLRGEETAKGYREVLSKIHYFNTRPDSYSKRIYSIQCAMLKARVLSNELVVTVRKYQISSNNDIY
uniref:CA domain-containing protein n=1 Tax=Heterorhabditis bacteriophora TaxID=37862 RepID=A0A1I7XTZ8_HETBA